MLIEIILIITAVFLLLILLEIKKIYKLILDKEESDTVITDEVNFVEIYRKAKEIVTQNNKASASLLQRELHIGYALAARLLDQLEKDGMIGPASGAEPRRVL